MNNLISPEMVLNARSVYKKDFGPGHSEPPNILDHWYAFEAEAAIACDHVQGGFRAVGTQVFNLFDTL